MRTGSSSEPSCPPSDPLSANPGSGAHQCFQKPSGVSDVSESLRVFSLQLCLVLGLSWLLGSAEENLDSRVRFSYTMVGS